MKYRKNDDNGKICKRNRKTRRLMVVSGWFLCAAAFIVGGCMVLGISGRYNLKRQVISYAAEQDSTRRSDARRSEELRGWQEGQIRHQGQNYRYNAEILTFLFMGIDKETGDNASGEYPDGGQADALFLLVLNPHDRTIRLIPVNRNTMTAVDIYDEKGLYENTVTAQICTQHGFGDGGKTSCEYQVKAVRNFMYGIPVHGYLAVDMDVISEVVELVGGIELEVLEDIRDGQGRVILQEGEQARLNGEQAYWYVRGRDTAVELSSDKRLERQSQFLSEFIHGIKDQIRQDVAVPMKIYTEASDRIVTDITADEVFYLASTAGRYHFDDGEIITIPGESVSGEENPGSDYDAFYADEEALYEMILAIFYEPAE